MIRTKLRRLSLIILAAFMSLTQTFCAKKVDIYDALEAGNYRVLQTTYSRLQSEFNEGDLSEYKLLVAYKLFYQRQDIFRKQLNGWIVHYPDSSVAYLARGIYYRKLGEFRRGTKYINQVPQKNIIYMEQMFQLAKKDLNKSLKLDPDSYLAVLHLLNIAQFEDNDSAARHYLIMGDRIFPENILMRARYLIHLTPRWGGSYSKMENFIKGERQYGLSRDNEKLLIAIELDDQGEEAQEAGDQSRAIAKYVKALTLTESAANWARHHYLQYSLQLCHLLQYHSKTYCQK